jgi:alpha-galactosidase
MHCAELNDQVADMAGNGYWNDPDMMVTGSAHALSVSQQEAHFALWCIMSSPLILGNDPRVMTEAEKKIIMNPEAIHINQDPLHQGYKVRDGGNQEVWIKKLSAGEVAVLLLNRDIDDPHCMEFDPSDVAIKGPFTVRDVLRHENLGIKAGITEFKVAPSSCRLLVVQCAVQGVAQGLKSRMEVHRPPYP